jgi:hypothetical protein
MSKNKINQVVFFLATLLLIQPGFCQNDQDKQALELLDKAMGPVGDEEGNAAVYFDAIAIGLKDPKEISSLPLYKVYKGGFFIQDKNKFEIQIGVMKALCDGKLMVVIDETAKSMVVDSVRDKPPVELGEMPSFESLMDDNFGDMKITYEGKEQMNGKLCHKIKGTFLKEKTAMVYYWVQVDNNHLQMIAEKNDELYDVYVVKKISTAPKNHMYTVNLPNKELKTFYGYQVYDFRYTSSRLNGQE